MFSVWILLLICFILVCGRESRSIIREAKWHVTTWVMSMALRVLYRSWINSTQYHHTVYTWSHYLQIGNRSVLCRVFHPLIDSLHQHCSVDGLLEGIAVLHIFAHDSVLLRTPGDVASKHGHQARPVAHFAHIHRRGLGGAREPVQEKLSHRLLRIR